MFQQFPSNVYLFCIGTLLSFILNGCTNPDDKGATQVVARVNDFEITVHQQNAAFAAHSQTVQNIRIDQQNILNKLIDNTLLKQALVSEHLTSKPETVQAITNAVTEAYASVYKDWLTANIAKPTSEEVLRHIKEHPDFFEKRQLFEVKELIILDNLSIQDVEFLAFKAQTIAQVRDWLKAHEIPFSNRIYYLTTELLRPEFSNFNAPHHKVDMIRFNEHGIPKFQSITPLMHAPIEPQDAPLVAEEQLIQLRYTEKINSELSRLRSMATIDVLQKQKH